MAADPDFQRRVESVEELGRIRRQIADLVFPTADADFARDSVVAAHELLANCFIHTNDDCTISVWMRGPPPSIRVEVGDTSHEQPAIRIGEPCYGLRIVDRVSTRWGSNPRRGGKVVWFEIGQPFGR